VRPTVPPARPRSAQPGARHESARARRVGHPPRTRTSAPSSYGARYELGTEVRARRCAGWGWGPDAAVEGAASRRVHGWRVGRSGGLAPPRPRSHRPGTPANSYLRTQLVRCTLRARRGRTSSLACPTCVWRAWPARGSVGGPWDGRRGGTGARRRPREPSPRTRTSAPSSYGARYELGTGVRVRCPHRRGRGWTLWWRSRRVAAGCVGDAGWSDVRRVPSALPSTGHPGELVSPHRARTVHATSSARRYELAAALGGVCGATVAGGGW